METNYDRLPYLRKRILNTEAHKEVNAASVAYTNCFTKEFLPLFMKGDDVHVDNFCQEEYGELQEKYTEVIGKID